MDPFTLPLQSVQIQKILGYPHAANQVFYLKGLRNGQEGYYYLKYAAHVDANLQNEVEIIRTLHSPLAPKVLEYDAEHFQYELTEQIEGKRLSIILKQTGSDNGLAFMREYGKTLAVFHQSKGTFPDAPAPALPYDSGPHLFRRERHGKCLFLALGQAAAADSLLLCPWRFSFCQYSLECRAHFRHSGL